MSPSTVIVVYTMLMIYMIQSGQAVNVTCDHTTAVCDCTSVSTTDDDDTCEFTLNIEHLQTFTRYQINEKTGFRGNGGRVWFINSDGNLEAHPNGSICRDISAEDPSCTQPITVDGYTFRSVITINSRFPGPTLIVDEEKYVMVHVNNNLASESISIHWHGMHQRDSSWMDGVEHVTQCGILPGATFTYVFQANQSGTHWYHSHSGAQRTEGLFGTLIVKESMETVKDVQGEVDGVFIDDAGAHSLTLLDWQYENSIDLFTQIHAGIRFYNETRVPGSDKKEIPRTYSIDESEVGPVTYWSGLINGKGRHKTINYIQTRLSIFTVEPNKTYRFRLIGAQSLYAYRVSIDGHKLRVIATDGAFVESVEVDYIILHSGERYDFLLQTKDTDGEDNFAIRANTLEEFYDREEKKTVPLGTNTAEAILHYSTCKFPSSSEYADILSSSNRKQCTSNAPCIALNCPFKNYPAGSNINCIHVHNLKAMFPMDESDLPNTTPKEYYELFYNFGFEGLQNSSAINAINLKLPSTPLIFNQSNPDERCDAFSNSKPTSRNCDIKDSQVISPECVCTHVHEISSEPGSVQLVLSAVAPKSTTKGRDLNNARFAHPIHLHGHYFHVVDIQFGTYDESGALTELNQDINCTGKYACTKPHWVDNKQKVNYSNKIMNAPRKDTILIPFGGYAVVFFKPDNPGYWFLHCHIEVHQLEGMGVIIGESIGKATAPPDHMPRCGSFDFDVDSFKKASGGSDNGGSTGGSGHVGSTSKWFMVSSLIAVAVAVLQCIVPHVSL